MSPAPAFSSPGNTPDRWTLKLCPSCGRRRQMPKYGRKCGTCKQAKGVEAEGMG